MSGGYRTIVADPPWQIGDFPEWGEGTGTIKTPYPTMTVEEIAALPIKGMADNRDGDAHLYLWTTNEYLFAAKDVAEAWGFRYVATLVWCKPPRGQGLGGSFASNVEFILYCRRPGYTSLEKREPRPDIAALTSRIGEITSAAGLTNRDLNKLVGSSDIASWWTSALPHRCAVPKPEHWAALVAAVPALAVLTPEVDAQNETKGKDRKPPTPLRGRVDTRWWTWPRGKHSEKPEAFLDLVEQVSPGPYLEIFARRARFGWDYAGDGSLGTVDIPGLRAPDEAKAA